MRFFVRFLPTIFRKFFGRKIFEIFLNSKKIYFFSELRIFGEYSFEVKLSDLSIYDVFRAFGVRQIWFSALTRYCEGTKICSISRDLWILVRNLPFSPLAMILNLEIIHDIHDELYIHQRGSVVLTLELLLTDFGRIICIIATSPQIEK